MISCSGNCERVISVLSLTLFSLIERVIGQLSCFFFINLYYPYQIYVKVCLCLRTLMHLDMHAS
ncbi:hypothetical protein BDV23DRAFT_158485 [Aspergillus alliaceus]|uniref:Uncharacterized protein n=1 Tax=Petromyces alliaceus TaxID=209559 RepID=A0A5N7C441_PETAA|nr:hypothetical protein BDV23DRAFT_158485 [Aspergillus alliaceus]